MATAQSTSLGPVHYTFQSETANQRWQLAGIITVCMHEKVPQEPPEHTSENAYCACLSVLKQADVCPNSVLFIPGGVCSGERGVRRIHAVRVDT